LTEAALEALDFDVDDANKPTNSHWWCVDGGAQKIAETMRKTMKDLSVIEYNTQVTGMNANVQLSKEVKNTMPQVAGPTTVSCVGIGAKLFDGMAIEFESIFSEVSVKE
jgi:hypothetical protein